MILVLDANAVVPNPELQGSTWRDIATAIRDGALTVIVPRIVAAEITARVQKNRRDQRPKSDVHRAPQSVKDALQEAIEEVERWAAGYDATIHLEAEGVVIRDTPTVAHDEVALRAINRGRPFNENGGGYRDALHWYTVLDLAREHPDEEIVFVSKDAAYRNSSRDDLHQTLRKEAEAVLTTGTVRLCTELKEFVPPQKYATEEDRIFPDEAHLAGLVEALFPNGKLHAPELWIALDLDDPIDADVSDPGDPELVWAFARDLVGGGRSYRTRIRLIARVAFDWIDWPDDEDDSSRQELDVTAWYVVDDGGFHVDVDRTQLSPAPVFTPAKPFRLETTSTTDAAWTRTSGLFDGWRSRELASAINSDILHSNAALRAKLQMPPSIAELVGRLAAQGIAPKPSLTSLGADIAQRQLRNPVVNLAAGFATRGALGPVADTVAGLARRGVTVPYGAVAAAAAVAAASSAATDDLSDADDIGDVDASDDAGVDGGAETPSASDDPDNQALEDERDTHA